jgi:hypothetical protein
MASRENAPARADETVTGEAVPFGLHATSELQPATYDHACNAGEPVPNEHSVDNFIASVVN